jgi:hypothetical protein
MTPVVGIHPGKPEVFLSGFPGDYALEDWDSVRAADASLSPPFQSVQNRASNSS